MNQQREKKRRKSNLTEGEKKKKKKKRCGKKIRNCDMFVVHLTGIYLSFCRVKQIFEASVLDAGKH